MNTNPGALTVFKQYVTSVETQLGNRVKTLRSDNGGEYVNKAFGEYLLTKGINHLPIAPYSHESNGKAETLNRTLFQMVLTSLLSSGLPKNQWGEAVNTGYM